MIVLLAEFACCLHLKCVINCRTVKVPSLLDDDKSEHGSGVDVLFAITDVDDFDHIFSSIFDTFL